MSKADGVGQQLINVACIHGSSDVAQLVRDGRWEETELGPIDFWNGTLCALTNLILCSPIPSAIHWGPSLLTIYNDAYAPLLGARHPEALGKSAQEIWPEVWGLVRTDYVETYEAGVAKLQERVLIPIAKQGRLQDEYWNYVITPIWEKGAVVGILKTCQNVTDQVLTTNALIESDERLRLALSASDCIGSWDWHIQSDLLYSDPRFASVFGANPTLASSGMPLSRYLENVHPEDRLSVELAIVRTIDSGEDYLAEYRLMQQDGSAVWVEARGRCIYAENGLPVRFPGTVFNLTARKQAQLGSDNGLLPHADSSASRRPTAWSHLAASGPESSGLRRAELIKTLDQLLTSRLEAPAASTHSDDRTQAEEILALLSEGLLLEHHFSSGKAIPVGPLTEVALRLQREHERFRGLHLVDQGLEEEVSNAHLAHLLHAVWALLGETIRRLGIDPVPLIETGVTE